MSNNLKKRKDKILLFFPDQKFNVTMDDDVTKIKVEDKLNQNCVSFILSINENNKENSNLYIKRLDKCNSASGTELLKLVESLSKSLGINSLNLIDMSTKLTECGPPLFSLSTLYILTTGRTWYNSKGYIDPDEQSYIDNENNELINLTLNVFLKKCEERIKKSGLTGPDYVLNNIVQEITNINSSLEPSLRTKDYFVRVAIELKSGKHCNLVRLLVKLINFIGHSKKLKLGTNEKQLQSIPNRHASHNSSRSRSNSSRSRSRSNSSRSRSRSNSSRSRSRSNSSRSRSKSNSRSSRNLGSSNGLKKTI